MTTQCTHTDTHKQANRFSDWRIWPSRIVDFWGKPSGFVDIENRVDCGSAVNFDADSGLCLSWYSDLGFWTKLIWIIDLSSALVGMLMSSSKIMSFFERSLFKLGRETVIGIGLCCNHQACCLLYYLGEINNGIHRCPFTFKIFTLPFPDVVVVSNLSKCIGGLIVSFAAVIRVVTHRSSPLTAPHSSSAFLSLCYWEPITCMYLLAARQSYFSLHLPPKTRFPE